MPAFKQNIDYNASQRPITIQYTDVELGEDRNLSFIYAADNERRQTQYTINNDLHSTIYYFGNYEKHIIGDIEKEYHYIHANGKMVAVMIKIGTQENMYYTCTDYLDNINMLISQTRTVAQTNSFDAWGRRRNPTDWSYNNISSTRLLNRGYTGHEHLDNFGLINMNARLYDPYIARMLSPDNLLQDPANSQNYNRYSYVLNNPLKYTDPTGNAPASAGYYFQARAMQAQSISHRDFYDNITAFLNTEKDDSWLQTFTTAGGTVAEVGMGDGGDDPKAGARKTSVNEKSAYGPLSFTSLANHHIVGNGLKYHLNTGSFNGLLVELNEKGRLNLNNLGKTSVEGLSKLEVITVGTKYENAAGAATLYYDGSKFVGYSDYWNFEPHPNGDRGLWNELKTWIGSWLPGKPFYVLYGTTPPLSDIPKN